MDAAFGVTEKDSAGSPRGTCAVHTIIGRNGPRRKGLKPSRRLSETTGPQPLGAFRVVFPASEVTKRGAWCKRAAVFLTHGTPAAASAGSPVTAAHVPAAQCRVVRSSEFKAMALSSLPRAQARTAHPLPQCQPRGCYGSEPPHRIVENERAASADRHGQRRRPLRQPLPRIRLPRNRPCARPVPTHRYPAGSRVSRVPAK